MKKLIVGVTAPGSVMLIVGQLKYFKSLGYETYLMSPVNERVVAYCESEGCIHLPINIEREISLLKDLKALFQVYAHLRKVKPDVVNFGTPKISLLGLLAAKLLSVKKRVYTCRGFRFEHEKGFKKLLLQKMDSIAAYCSNDIICISHSVMELGVSEGILKKSKCNVINKGSSNGMDLDRFNPQNIKPADKIALKQQLNIPEGDFVFGFVGRISDRKGNNELFQAFKEIYTTNKKVKLLIVGPIESSQLANPGLIQEMLEHPGVILPGRTDDVPLFLSLMDVFVLPTWCEGFGNVLIQAAAMGIPVISTFGTGTKDAVNNGYNGILVPVKDVAELKNAMTELHANENLKTQLGKNGLEWAQNFKSEIIWEGMNEIYRK